MRRRTLDALLTTGGLALAALLLVAGGLLTWAHVFISDQVTTQLSAQKIFFPPKDSQALAPPEVGRYLNQYAGQQLVSGAQAQAYANHFIAVHLKEAAGGKTYAQVSSQAQQNPNDVKLAGQVQTLFRGETLRGMLLNAYAFWKIGQIALLASIASFALAAVMLVLTILGFSHLRRVSPTQELMASTVESRKTPMSA